VGRSRKGHVIDPPPPKKKSEKYFSGNYHVKFGHFVNFSYTFDGLIGNLQINDDCDIFRLTHVMIYRRYFHNGNFREF